MKKPNTLRLFLYGLGACLCTIGQVFWVADLFRLLTPSSTVTIILVCIVITLIIVSMRNRIFRYTLLLSLTVSIALLAILYIKRLSEALLRLEEFVHWIAALHRMRGSETLEFAFAFNLSLAALVSLIFGISVIVLKKAAPVCLSVLTSVITICFLYTVTELHLHVLIPAAAGMILLLALTSRGEESRFADGFGIGKKHLLAIGGLIGVVTFLLMISVAWEHAFPAENMRSEPFESNINRLIADQRERWDGPAPEIPESHLYDLGIVGMGTSGQTLGGPLILTDDILIEVTTNRDLLLKASTRDDYRVMYWDTRKSPFEMFFEVPEGAPYSLSNRPFLNGVPGSAPDRSDAASFRASFFDTFRPDPHVLPTDIISSVMEETDVLIRNASEHCGASVLYPDHLVDAVYDEPLLFNENASLYTAGNIPVGDSYTVRSMVFRYDRPDFIENLLALESYVISTGMYSESSEHIRNIRSAYLPADVPLTVSEYALRITENADTPLQKALAIRDHLMTEFTYSTDVPEVPPGHDFVQYFLITREGYCVYFASAMCMMARVNNIPARFVEGVFVDVPEKEAGAPSTVIVTSRSAHAWCEIYIDGIGWIPIDATPGGAGFGTDPDISVSPTESVTPTAAPTGLPTPPAESDPTGISEPPQSSVPGNSSPFDPATTETDETSKETGTTQRELPASVLFPIVFLLLAIVVVLLSAFLYSRQIARFYRIPTTGKRMPDQTSGELLTFYYRRILNHLRLLGIRIDPRESPHEFALKVRSVRPSARGCVHDIHFFEVCSTALAYERMIYGQIDPTEADINDAYAESLLVAKIVRDLHFSKIAYFGKILFTLTRNVL